MIQILLQAVVILSKIATTLASIYMPPAQFLPYSMIVNQPKTTWPVIIKKPLGKTLNTSIWFWCALTDRPNALMLTSWKSAESKKTKRNQSSDQSRDSTQLSVAKRPFVCLANFTNHLKTLLTNKDLKNRFIQKNLRQVTAQDSL